MTNDFIKETMKVSSGAIALLMLKISHEDWLDDLRVVGNTSEITHDGAVYLPYGLGFSAPKEGGSTISTNIVIDDIFRVVTTQFELVLDSVNIDIFVILASNPELIEKDFGSFSVDAFNVTGKQVSLTVTRNTILRNSLSSHTVTPEDFTGLFLI